MSVQDSTLEEFPPWAAEFHKGATNEGDMLDFPANRLGVQKKGPHTHGLPGLQRERASSEQSHRTDTLQELSVVRWAPLSLLSSVANTDAIAT